MIKVLHFVSSLSINSGLMSVIMNYYRSIDRNNVQFGFAFFKNNDKGTYLSEIEEYGGKTYYTHIDKRLIKRSLENLFDSIDERYDILQIHELYLAFIVEKIARKHGIKVVIGHAHTIKFSENFWSGVRNQILCSGINRYCDYEVACSKEAGEVFFGKNIYSDKFFILNNAIDIKRYEFCPEERKRIRSKFSYADDDIVIGHVGRFSPAKNHSFIIEVFKALCEQSDRYKLLLVGEGPDEERIKNLVKAFNLEGLVKFMGRREDVNLLYSAMDIFLFPSLYEGLGYALIEAQANGLTCIASETIPLQAKILESYTIINLNEGPFYWAKKIIDSRITREEHCSGILTDYGYNIAIEGNKLEEKYRNMMKGNKNAGER